MDAEKRIDDLLFLTTELAELLERENAALKTKNYDVVKEHSERKAMLCRAYEIRVFGMKQDNYTATDDETLRGKIERLLEVGRTVDELIDENEKMLRVALEVSRRFMGCIAETVRQATPGAGLYSASGETGPQSHAAQKQAASLALDETL